MKKTKTILCTAAVILVLLTSCVIFAANAMSMSKEEAFALSNAKTLQSMYDSIEFTYDDILVVYNPNIDTYYTYINYRAEETVHTAVFMQNTYIDTLQSMAELAQSDSSDGVDFLQFAGMYMPYITYRMAVDNPDSSDIILVKADKILERLK